MVSELAPVVLYLRHLVQPGELLIIEEPEAHLHPGMQAAFTRELARLVTTGVRIVITTTRLYPPARPGRCMVVLTLRRL